MAELRPSKLKVFASGSGNILEPTADRYTAGYPQLSAFPSAEANYLYKSHSTMLAYLETVGTALWVDDIPYFKDSRARGSNGHIYRSKADNNLNHNPVLDVNEDYWEDETEKLSEGARSNVPHPSRSCQI